MLRTLFGQWHLIYTNLSMWKSGKAYNITFNYSPAEKNNELCLLDEVKYMRGIGTQKKIRGYDFLDAVDTNRFVWHGVGIIFWIRCPWRVEWIDEAQSCIVLSFEKTLLTGGGVDVVCRDKNPPQETLRAALSFIESHETLRQQAKGMIRTLQK